MERLLIEETPIQTFRKFTKDPEWIKNSSIDALAGDLLVGQAESKLEWFACYYINQDGILIDPKRGPIVGTDGGVSAQKEFNDELQGWFINNESGLAVGISPKGGKFNHPDNQLQIYRIAYEWVKDDNGKIIGQRKALLCAFHQFDYDFNNPEEIRRFIFPEKDTEEGVLNLVTWLKSKSRKKVEDSLRNYESNMTEAYGYAEQLKSGVDPEIVFGQILENKFLGNNPIGCDVRTLTSGFGYSKFNEIKNWTYHIGDCVNCHKANTEVGPCNICKECEKIL